MEDFIYVISRDGNMAFVVTPWEVSGDIDYNKLIEQFGTKPLSESMLENIRKHTGELHHMLRRKIFFSHRDLDVVLRRFEQGKPFALYTGRGPSGNTHIGHLVPWIFTKWLQDKFDVELYFQITNDEKYFVKDLSIEQTTEFAYENALDIIAMGFDPDKTHIFIDTEYAKTLYNIALKISRKVTFSQAKAVFGFTNETNLGLIHWPAMQAAPCFLPSVLKKRNVGVLIPAAIDQDPYWRITRDVAPRLGFPKPAAIHNVFLPPLQGTSGKMSSSEAHTAIYTTDDSKTIKKKINKYAFSGGQATLEEHRKLGGNPEVDIPYQWLRFFEEDDDVLSEIYVNYKSGALLTGEIKQMLIKKLTRFLENHQKERIRAKKRLDDFLLRD